MSTHLERCRVAVCGLIAFASGFISTLESPSASAAPSGGACYETQVETSAQRGGARGRDSTISASVTTRSIETQEACPDGDGGAGVGGGGGPVEALGGGDGGEVSCSVRALGPLEQVRKVIAAVNAERTPKVRKRAVTNDVVQGQGGPDVPLQRGWYRTTGFTVEVLHAVRCGDAIVSEEQWLTMRAQRDATGAVVLAVPQVRAVDLVPALHSQVVRQLPTPLPRIGPADTNPNGWTFVQHPTFFWVDQTDGQWATVSATASAGAVSVTVHAEPVNVVVDPGDGGAPVTCAGAPVEVTVDNYDQTADQACSYRYRHSSAMAANGETYPVSLGIAWQVSWSSNTGEAGDLGSVTTTSPTRWLAVAEIQAIITDTESR